MFDLFSHSPIRIAAFTFICGVGVFFAGSAQAQTAGPVVISNDHYSFSVDRATINSWVGMYALPDRSIVLRPQANLANRIYVYVGGARPNGIVGQEQYRYNPEKVYDWVAGIGPVLSSQPQEPVLEIANGRAVNFKAPLPGQKLDAYQTTHNVLEALEFNRPTALLTVSAVAPRTALADLNTLGIRELIARGESSFAGSPRNRQININVGLEKIKGVIIAPGATFSFNRYLGPVEADQGFVPELVIRRDKGTVPELGGGLCQVSSTTFRAAMNAGLPIVERRNHSYAVQYYAPQGTDATIYPGVVDLKFTNDTPGSILIWPYLKDKTTLIFDFYGTKDDREVLLEKPYTYDRKSDGSMKATWSRTVIKNGEKLEDTFKSVYLPPALFHKEEEFVPATPPPGTIIPPPEGTVPPPADPVEQPPTPPATSTPIN